MNALEYNFLNKPISLIQALCLHFFKNNIYATYYNVNFHFSKYNETI